MLHRLSHTSRYIRYTGVCRGRGAMSWPKGRAQTPDHIAKRVEASKRNPTRRQGGGWPKGRPSHRKGKRITDAHRARISEGMKRSWARRRAEAGDDR